MLNPGRDWRTALIFGNLTHEGPGAAFLPSGRVGNAGQERRRPLTAWQKYNPYGWFEMALSKDETMNYATPPLIRVSSLTIFILVITSIYLSSCELCIRPKICNTSLGAFHNSLP
jgi:hypothetical protein